MILAAKPWIAVLNERKIYVCRKPGFAAWLFFSLSVIIFIGISQLLTKNFLYLVVLILGEITFGLDAFGDWEELLLDKEENNAVITKYTWTDKLCFKVSRNCRFSMKLTDIRHVGVSIDLGLFILHRTGKTISLSMQGFTREELQKLKREINYFLDAGRIKSHDISANNPGNLTSILSNSKYLCKTLKTQSVLSILKKVPISIDTLRNCKIQYPIRYNLSLPILGLNVHKKKNRQFCLTKRPGAEMCTHCNRIRFI